MFVGDGEMNTQGLTLILLMWRIVWAPHNTSKWQTGFKSAFKGLIQTITLSIKMKRNRSLNTTNGLLAKMESS